MVVPEADDLPPRSVAVVLGTRPELIKLGDLLRLLGRAARLVHTGQHYEDSLSGDLIRELGLPDPVFLDGVGGHPRATQIGSALIAVGGLFRADPPHVVVVQGDTNAALTGALAANSQGVPLLHVEAGLRSHDRAMPEEHNRVLIDHLSDVLCAATPGNRDNLRAEGVPDARVTVTGNPVVEAVRQRLPGAQAQRDVLHHHGLESDRYILATLHRPENTDRAETLETVLRELSRLAGERYPVLLTLHPRTRERVTTSGARVLLTGLRVFPPLGYGTFLTLVRHAALVVSDSGGVQEEVTVLGRPLVIVRRSTERPEVLADHARMVAPGPAIGAAADELLDAGPALLARLRELPSPFGDGHASHRVHRALRTLAGLPTDHHPAPSREEVVS